MKNAATPDRQTLPEALPPGRYLAVQQSDGAEHGLGRITLDGDGMMHPDAPAVAETSDLPRIVKAMNEKQVLHVDVFPPPDAPRFAMTSRIVSRGDADFVPALLEQLKRFYGVELRGA